MSLLTTTPNAAYALRSSSTAHSSRNVLRLDSQENLVRPAWSRLQRLAASESLQVTQEMVQALSRVFTLLVTDGGPTPQLAANPDGTLEVQWLVNGDLVQVEIDDCGDWSLWAVTADDAEVVDEEYAAGTNPSGRSLTAARMMLARMGRDVQFRVDQ